MGFYVGEDIGIGQRGRLNVIWSLSTGEETVMFQEMGGRNQAPRFGEMSEGNVCDRWLVGVGGWVIWVGGAPEMILGFQQYHRC